VIGLKSIKSSTVDGYLFTIKKFLKNFDPKSDRDARMFTGAAVIAAPIKKVIDEMKRFEKQPNRQEPWTLQLQSRLFRETDDKPADSLAKAGCQWYCCVFPAGLQFRAQKIEKGCPCCNACLHRVATSKVRRCTPSPVPCVDRWDSLCVLIPTGRTVW
jgi:hypothetical protein